MSNQSLLTASLAALRVTPVTGIPIAEVQSHYRNIAIGFNQVFSKFAVDVCGCDAPQDRVKLKKSVWFQTTGMRLARFESPTNRPLLQTLAEMECPVQILSKGSSASRDESSPSKIILASKLLRAHFGISEATACRGCSKRSRCPFVRKVVTNTNTKTSLGAVTKVLYGMSQSCRLHLKDPKTYPFVMSAKEVEAAIDITHALEKFLAPSAIDRQLKNVPIADRNAVKAIVTKQLRKNKALDEKRRSETKDGIPEWMGQAAAVDASATAKLHAVKETKPKFDIDSAEWVPEEKEAELGKSNLKFASDSDPVRERPVAGTVASIDSISDLAILRRFPEATMSRQSKSTARKDKKERIDISKVSIVTGTGVSGGYAVGSAEPTSTGVEYLKPEFLRGKTVLDNVSIAGKLWRNANSGLIDLKFLKRVPYVDTVPKPGAAQLSDPILAKVLSSKDAAPDVTREADVWKFEPKRSPTKIGLIDRRVDGRGEQAEGGNVQVVSIPHTGSPLSDQSASVESNQRALSLATSANGPNRTLTESATHVETTFLEFPKLPNWDPSSLRGAQDTGVRAEYRNLMRPTDTSKTVPKKAKKVEAKKVAAQLDAKEEQDRSAIALQRVAEKRRREALASSKAKGGRDQKRDIPLRPTSPVDAARLWRVAAPHT